MTHNVKNLFLNLGQFNFFHTVKDFSLYILNTNPLSGKRLTKLFHGVWFGSSYINSVFYKTELFKLEILTCLKITKVSFHRELDKHVTDIYIKWNVTQP